MQIETLLPSEISQPQKGFHHFSHGKVTTFIVVLALFGLEIFLVSGFSPSYVATSYSEIVTHELFGAYWIDVIGILPVLVAFEFFFLKNKWRIATILISIIILLAFPLITFFYRIQLWSAVFKLIDNIGAIEYATQIQTGQLPEIIITIRKDSSDIRTIQSKLDQKLLDNNDNLKKYTLEGTYPLMAFTIAEKISGGGSQEALSPKNNSEKDYTTKPGEHLLLFLVIQPELGNKIITKSTH